MFTLTDLSLREAGLVDSKYAAHSFWTGTAKSNAYQLYVHTLQENLASLSSGSGQQLIILVTLVSAV